MSHLVDLNQILGEHDPQWLKALDHILQCHDCAHKAQQLLDDELVGAEALSTRQLARLERLSDRFRRNLEDLSRFVRSLERERKQVSFLVRSRLQCLVADHLAPAVKDLESIEKNARGNLAEGAAK